MSFQVKLSRFLFALGNRYLRLQVFLSSYEIIRSFLIRLIFPSNSEKEAAKIFLSIMDTATEQDRRNDGDMLVSTSARCCFLSLLSSNGNRPDSVHFFGCTTNLTAFFRFLSYLVSSSLSFILSRWAFSWRVRIRDVLRSP